jgi:hypothetical protein
MSFIFIESERSNLKLHSKYNETKIIIVTNCTTDTTAAVVGIATSYGLGDPGIETRWRRDFPHPSRPFRGPTNFL